MKFRNIHANALDNQCFKWCVIRALKPTEIYPERTTKQLKEKAEKSLNYDGIEFPMKLKDINKFEKQNPKISVNVLGQCFSTSATVRTNEDDKIVRCG